MSLRPRKIGPPRRSSAPLTDESSPFPCDTNKYLGEKIQTLTNEVTREKATRKAYSELVNHVFAHIRNGIGKGHPDWDDLLFDLGDAMHNVSVMLQDDKGWIDDSGYRIFYLIIYDKKWSSKTDLCLSDFIESKISEYMNYEDLPSA